MGIDLLLLGLLGQAQAINVQVVNFRSRGPIEGAYVYLDDGDRTRRLPSRRQGRAQFRGIACSEDLKFWAQVPDEPLYPNPSEPAWCEPRERQVTLRIRPNSR